MESEDIMEYHNQDFPSSLLSTFEEMKENEDLCDVTIKVKDKCIQAHRLILAAGVPYFRAMFRSNMVENTKRQVTMEDVDPIAFQCLIDFLYSGKLLITVENVEAMLATAIYLQLSSISNVCFEFLLKRIQPNTVVKIRSYAVHANHVSTVMTADRYIREHFEEVSQSKEFLSLTFPVLNQFVSSDELFLLREEVVFEAVMKWVKASATNRQTFLPKLLLHVRMPLLSPEYVTNRVSEEDLIKSSPRCRRILLEAKKCQSVMSSSTFFSDRQRYCKEKHHLKCARIMGCGLYAFSQTIDGCCSLVYYDAINENWVTLHQFTEVSCFSYIVCSQEMLCLIGTEIFYTFNFETLKYTSVRSERRVLCYAAAILHQGNIYFVGGYKSPISVRRFCPYSGELFNFGKIIQKRYSPGLASLAGDIFITGGRSTMLSNDDKALKSAERFMPDTGESTVIAPLLESRCGHGCASLHNKVYVCGGSPSFRSLFSTEVYDPETGQWKFIARRKSVAFQVSLVTYADKLYAFEGLSVNKNNSNVECYDPRSKDEWMTWKCVPCPHNCYRITAVATTVVPISL